MVNLSFTDVNETENTISVTDIKHHFYCPKIIYFDKVLHAPPKLATQQEESKKIHEDSTYRQKRNKLLFSNRFFKNTEKFFDLRIYSKKLALEGVIDCVVKKNGQYIIVDYKNMYSKKGKMWPDHKYQIIAYALLVDECFSTSVNEGFVYYIPEQMFVKIEITDTMKRFLIKNIMSINNVISNEIEPHANIPRSKCSGGCGYLWICGGIWTR